jgi:23S rRNA pseudouridine2605 synthase
VTKPRVTLDRILSRAGIASRSTTRDWIHFDGRPIRAEKKLYIALNKPTGVVTSHGDSRNRSTVYDYLKKLDRWVFPVGRLDMDTSGLLILTNDTEFGDRLLSPDSKIPKTYYVKVSGSLDLNHFFDLAFGLNIGRGEESGLARVQEVRRTEKYTWFELTITEGKNRQVRRMCEAIGRPVLKLVRIRIGGFALGALPVGDFVALAPADLRKLVNPNPSATTC